MSLYIVDIHGELEGDYEIIKKYEEPFINKPCVSEKTCEHDKNVVLDKIRAEIAELDLGFIDEDYKAGVAYAVMIFNKILDKYKAESEGE